MGSRVFVQNTTSKIFFIAASLLCLIVTRSCVCTKCWVVYFLVQCCVFRVLSCVLSLLYEVVFSAQKRDFLNVSGNHEIRKNTTAVVLIIWAEYQTPLTMSMALRGRRSTLPLFFRLNKTSAWIAVACGTTSDGQSCKKDRVIVSIDSYNALCWNVSEVNNSLTERLTEV